MARPADPDGRALWGRVARTVRQPGEPRRPVALDWVPAPAPVPDSASGGANTLDASWDKRLAAGMVRPDAKVDLHGLTVAAAHERLDAALASAWANGARLLLVVAGKPRDEGARVSPGGRGVIRASVGDWLDASPHAGAIAAVRPAHLRHGGSGALYVVLRRRR